MNLVRTLQRLAVLLLVLVMGLAACNTINGFGRDVQRAGEKIEDASDRH